jgi:hypothetical protein
VSDMNIHQRINAVMRDCVYLQKTQAQQGKGIRYDEVMAMIRQHLINHGVIMVIRQTEMITLACVEGTKQKVYQGKYEMDLINMDKPEELVTHSCYAQGMDGGDKGAGKAHTYAMKTILVKGFGIETGEDEESRSDKEANKELITNEQSQQLFALLCDESGNYTQTGSRMAAAYKFNNLHEIPASKFDEILKKAQQ